MYVEVSSQSCSCYFLLSTYLQSCGVRRGSWIILEFYPMENSHTLVPLLHVLEKLAACGTKMVIISNSSRRASTTMEKLSSLGFNPSLFLGAITSGELTHQYLLRRDDPWFAALGNSCIHMTWSDRGAISLEGLGLQVVENVEEAQFVLAHGTEALGLPSGDALPMRTLATTYEKLGGEVKWMGKPGEIIYKSAMAMAGVEASDSFAVGDSLHHDIKGANIAGISSALTTGGIHATELGLTAFGEAASESSVRSLDGKYEA
ncbi:hypothetical protein SASPL_139222 [Salvia splendens]|uniref:4-nitrophenyl phosphatase n=1 Tax=Salvia splendens TaxID=180675 RepID=A0A8X8ZFS4_SALSN|nr:hypothetical protein SASPL_139222 [Salvia splendens]